MLPRFPIKNTNWDFEESPDFRDSEEYKNWVEQFYKRIPSGWLSIRSLKAYMNEPHLNLIMEFIETLIAERRLEKKGCFPELYKKV